MKITGISIIRNAIKNDYPIVEAINSILPVVDEMIVTVDPGEDATLELIKSIPSDKIKIYPTVWDMSIREGGKVLAVETDKAIQLVPADSDWIFYIQADEVVHEKYHPAILEAARKYKDDKAVEGLLFKYTHFYGTYDYVGDSRKWYDTETRIIRNDKSIHSYRDAQGFRKGEVKLKVALIDAYIYHYGWVKSPRQMKLKRDYVSRYWNKDVKESDYSVDPNEVFDFNDFDSLARFTGTHPAVMKDRIEKQNWKLDLDISKKKFNFKNKALYWIEKTFGLRPFAFSNHKIIRK